MKAEIGYHNLRVNSEGHQWPERLFTVREVATMLRVSLNTVRSWSDLGLIRSYRVGPRGDRRYMAKDIDSFIVNTRRDLGGAALIIAGDIGIQQLIGSAVAERGFEAVAVGSSERALTELESQRFDVIFLDLVLPGLGGVDVLQAIKERNHRTLVVVMIAIGDYPTALETMSLWPLLLMRKPLNQSDITAVLDMVMWPRL